MAEITTLSASVAAVAVSATAASVQLIRVKNTSGVGISGHSETRPNAPAGVKVTYVADNTGSSAGPLYVRAFGAATAVTSVTTGTAQFVVEPNESLIIPAGEAVYPGNGTASACYSVKLSGITGTGGLGTMTAEWVDKTS